MAIYYQVTGSSRVLSPELPVWDDVRETRKI